MAAAPEEYPQGFIIPIHASLTKRLLMAGVPRELAITKWTFAAALTIPLHSWYGIPLGLLVHSVALYAAKKDPDFFDVFRRGIRYKTFYRR